MSKDRMSRIIIAALLVVTVGLLVMVILIASDGGDAAVSVERSGITWPVPEGWLRDKIWPTAVEPVEPAVGIMNPPHWICPDPKEC